MGNTPIRSWMAITRLANLSLPTPVALHLSAASHKLCVCATLTLLLRMDGWLGIEMMVAVFIIVYYCMLLLQKLMPWRKDKEPDQTRTIPSQSVQLRSSISSVYNFSGSNLNSPPPILRQRSEHPSIFSHVVENEASPRSTPFDTAARRERRLLFYFAHGNNGVFVVHSFFV